MVFPPSQRSDRHPAHATEAQSTFGNTVSTVAASVAATKVACVEKTGFTGLATTLQLAGGEVRSAALDFWGASPRSPMDCTR
jgi:hypothetical protein